MNITTLDCIPVRRRPTPRDRVPITLHCVWELRPFLSEAAHPPRTQMPHHAMTPVHQVTHVDLNFRQSLCAMSDILGKTALILKKRNIRTADPTPTVKQSKSGGPASQQLLL
ncbi:unnamed protein product [Echinostoma caproni]|uniref:Uncharacterized protein n=1 Tax=Echinostoma caproni TaxID=27848 RepID=A0A183B2Q4_9TREM|nr:unnamed protein product [Echinostoma caproni]